MCLGKGVLSVGEPTSSFLILLLFSLPDLSSISPTFTVTEAPTPIYLLSRFASFLLQVIVTTGSFWLIFGVGLIIDCGSDSRVCCQTVFFQFQQKTHKQAKNCPGVENQELLSQLIVSRDPAQPTFLGRSTSISSG